MQMWHGGRRWIGGPELRQPKKGRAEGGPGIYLTNKYARARSYAKGGGVTILTEVDDSLTLARDVSLDVDAVARFLDGLSGLRNRKALTRDILCDLKGKPRETIPGNFVVNLFVNHEAGTGKVGLDLADFLVENGIDASLEHATGNEEWMVIHNPRILTSWRVLEASEADALESRDFDRPSEVLDYLRSSSMAP